MLPEVGGDSAAQDHVNKEGHTQDEGAVSDSEEERAAHEKLSQ